MYFDSWQQAWEMAGHGPYVWGAISICLLLFIWLPVRELIAQRQLLRREQRRQQLLSQQASMGNT
ncbi:MAG: heme exporter protein CcmD [Gammaproteobacteria bacterium]|nr:MAG: heme exporter protein CcmD [Gammaproteobacteria bacterium]